MSLRIWTTSSLLALAACRQAPPTPEPNAPSAPAPVTERWDRVEREDFNRWAMKLNQPFFWSGSADDERLDPDELAVLWRYGDGDRSRWVDGEGFTDTFAAAYAEIAAAAGGSDDDRLSAEARARRDVLRREIDQGRPTLLASDFRDAPEADRALVRHIVAVAELIEDIHARQRGTAEAFARIDALDPASRTVLVRNQSPFCAAPATEKDPSCTAVPGAKRVFGLYPASIQQQDDFCDRLAARPDADRLLTPFTVVRERNGELVAVPYAEAYDEPMGEIAKHLRAAAEALDPASEGPFIAYLRAAARAFETNDWFSADEAWAAMNAENSKWYLRVGPDEVYYEPCNRKAGFHVSFARINQASLAWQSRLEPVKQGMEDQLAKMAGPPYRARKVSFHLPDFIDIVLNAGNSRAPHGATIGQSLPNWGPVANQGRGRTVAMTNLYTDADSRRILESQAASLFCADAMAQFSSDPEALVMSIVLHEAAHNLGPAHEYAVNGRTDDEIFGGPLASTMEELKAQSSALYLSDWLAEQGVISAAERDAAHMRDLAWAFGHISRGMYTAAGQARSYSQLAAIQLGHLLDAGAVKLRPDETAANGEDVGCFGVDLEALSASVEALEAAVLRIKGRGDAAGAKALKARYVDAEDRAPIFEMIQERWLRAPKATFVYAIRD